MALPWLCLLVLATTLANPCNDIGGAVNLGSLIDLTIQATVKSVGGDPATGLLKVCPSSAICALQVDLLGVWFCFGYFSEVTLTKNSGVNISYSGVGTGGGQISINCDPSADPYTVNQIWVNVNDFTLGGSLNSKFACPDRCLLQTINGCNSCTSSSSHCSWCLDTSTCLHQSTPCPNTVSNSNYCPPPNPSCSDIQDCQTCSVFGCNWCLGKNQCSKEQKDCTEGHITTPMYCPKK